MKRINIVIVLICATSLSLSAQLNLKKLKDKAAEQVNTSTKQPAQVVSQEKSSSESVFGPKKIDMEKLDEQPEGNVKNLSLFYAAGWETMKNTVGLVLSSPDGINWKEEFKSPSMAIADVAYGEGKIVAVAGTTVFFTTDGTTWKSVEGTTNGILNGAYSSVAYGVGMFVAVGTTNTVAFSKDGETWVRYFGEEIDPEYDDGVIHFYGVSFCNGKFYFVGNSNRIVTMVPDAKQGLIKEKCSTLGRVTDRLDDVAYGNNAYVAVGTKDDYYSTDGLNWTVTSPEWQNWGIYYANGLFVKACGFGRIFTSPDGANNNWTEVFQMMRTKLNDACYGNNKWIVTGDMGKVVTSTDGQSWEYHEFKPLYAVKKVIFIP